MSVIAKFNVYDEPRNYGGETQLVNLMAVGDPALYAGNDSGRANENRSFSTATPSGDARITLPASIQFIQMEELYLIFLRGTERPAFEGAMAVVDARCVSVTDFGGTSKRVDVASVYRDRGKPKDDERLVDQFSMRMTIDNPKASVAFVPPQEGYYVGIYRCRDLTMRQALDLALGDRTE